VDRLYSFRKLRASSAFKALVASIEDAIKDPLSLYSVRLRPRIENAGHQLRSDLAVKSLRDPTWGFIDLWASEVLIVDSPTFQRLRYVRQLGLSQLVYQTAGYSRFDHSIGALHQANLMLTRLTETADANHREIIRAERRAIRLAALIHDIGHLPLSHVTERFYSERETADSQLWQPAVDASADVGRVLNCSAPSLSETLSLAVISTPSFLDLLKLVDYDETEIATAIFCIVGQPWDLRKAFLTQVVSSFIDADKLDYMTRDSQATGLPIQLDLPRVLNKLRIARIDLKALDKSNPLKQMAAPSDHLSVLAFDTGGEPIVDDMISSRALLYERIYLHHKTRAGELLVLDMLAAIKPALAELIRFDDSYIQPVSSQLRSARVRDIARALSERDLPRRCMAIPTSVILKTAAASRWQLARDRISDQKSVTRIAERMAGVTRGAFAGKIRIDTPPRGYEPDLSQIFIIRPGGQVEVGSPHYYPAPPSCHVFVIGDSDMAHVGYCATQLFFYQSYDVQLGADTAHQAKLDYAGAINEKKIEIEARVPDIYDKAGVLRPVSFEARAPRNDDDIAQLAKKFAAYDPGRPVNLGPDGIRSFLDQFPEGLVLPMLDLLKETTFLTAEDFLNFESHLLRAAKSPGTLYVPLTSGFKSAAHIAYNFNSLKPVTLADALASSERDIVLFDDCIISGSQARTVVQTWFGDPPDLDEPLASQLQRSEIASLRGRRLRFEFGYGVAKGKKRLGQLLKKHGLTGAVGSMTTAQTSLKTNAAVSRRHSLVDFLRSVGYSVLKSTKGSESGTRWTDWLCRYRALGYGDDAQLVVLGYNTPTGTVTALWKAGTFRRTDWHPLLPRRERP
jgi:HD superfamily phosphohydrolase